MKIKSILIKYMSVFVFSFTGLFTLGNHNAKAAIVKNDASTYTVHKDTIVYNKYRHGKVTGQVLAANTSWKVIKTAYDKQGNKWYDLGKRQWVKVEQSTSQAVNSSANNNVKQIYQASNVNNNSNTHYTSNASGSEASAKAWIASRESGGSYSARNGQYIGKYQLSSAYLGGDYSAANQERAADNYVKGRYGSWNAAKSFWQANGWY